MMTHNHYNQIEQGADILIAMFGDNAIGEARREQRMAELEGRKNEWLYWRAIEDETKWLLALSGLSHKQYGHA